MPKSLHSSNLRSIEEEVLTPLASWHDLATSGPSAIVYETCQNLSQCDNTESFSSKLNPMLNGTVSNQLAGREWFRAPVLQKKAPLKPWLNNMHHRERAFIHTCNSMQGFMCTVFLCGWEAVWVCFCQCVHVLSTLSRYALGQKKKCSALIVCDLVEELKGILPLNHRDGESETKTRSERVGRARAKEGR